MDSRSALAKYTNEYKGIIERCQDQMGEHGWAMVKACADRDIEAEEALQKY
jgi:hypothetical protein